MDGIGLFFFLASVIVTGKLKTKVYPGLSGAETERNKKHRAKGSLAGKEHYLSEKRGLETTKETAGTKTQRNLHLQPPPVVAACWKQLLKLGPAWDLCFSRLGSGCCKLT